MNDNLDYWEESDLDYLLNLDENDQYSLSDDTSSFESVSNLNDIQNSYFLNESYPINRNISRTSEDAQKGKIIIPINAQIFKENYYLIFTNKKKFSKRIVREIHENYLVKGLNLSHFSRDNFRVVSKYFEEYLSKSKEILYYLMKNREMIISNTPNLAEHLNKSKSSKKT